MRRKDFSFLIFNHAGSPIKRLSVSRKIIGASITMIVMFVAALSIFAYDYISLRNNAETAVVLSERVTEQEDLISHQRKQIQNFAVQINDLKSEISDLNAFEKKMRIIANYETEETEADGVFGIGGSMPEDIDPTIEMKERQTALIQEMHEQVNHLDMVAVSQQERFEALYEHMQEQRNILACTPTIRPVEDGYISSSFGYRTSPFTEKKEFHKGLDIATKKGTPIIATADGIVTFSKTNGSMGKTITIDHGYGIVSRYGHCEKLLKNKGDEVKRGEVIALVGNTGKSTGPHIHYEVKLNGVQVDPDKYILN